MKILVIEDDVDLRNAIQIVLSTFSSHSIVYNGTVKQSINYLKTHKPDAIFLDYFLDDGIVDNLIQYTQFRNPAPILVLMSGIKNIYQVAGQYNIKHVLKKPFGVQEVLDVIETIEKEFKAKNC